METKQNQVEAIIAIGEDNSWVVLDCALPPSEQIEKYFSNAEGINPSGTQHGWQIRKEGSEPERQKCEDRKNFIHVVLEA